jgi:tRNA(Ile)-lysidine synthase
MILIAYSGGIDSTVLLHQLIQTHPRDQLRAIHINHALYPEADHWQAHCEQTCQHYGIPLTCIKLTEKPKKSESLEAWARQHRHHIFAAHLQPDEILMTAQHADDQAETVLLQLLRGAGPKGLSAMPAEKSLGEGRHQRPLLNTSKADIIKYAQEHQLTWITDHSNADHQFDRNYIRGALMPILKERWPSAHETLSRSAAHCAEQEALLQLLLAPIYLSCAGSRFGTLSLKALKQHDELIQRAIIRHWLSEKKFPMPGHKKFDNIFDELIPARPDANPIIAWGEVCIRRYRDDLYALKLVEILPSGERKPGMKKIFQEQGIPPWERG